MWGSPSAQHWEYPSLNSSCFQFGSLALFASFSQIAPLKLMYRSSSIVVDHVRRLVASNVYSQGCTAQGLICSLLPVPFGSFFSLLYYFYCFSGCKLRILFPAPTTAVVIVTLDRVRSNCKWANLTTWVSTWIWPAFTGKIQGKSSGLRGHRALAHTAREPSSSINSPASD